MKSTKCIAIKCLPNYGPIFGNNDIIIEKDMGKGQMGKTKNSSFLLKNTKIKDIIGDNGENGNFIIKEMEMFSIIY